jgi:hypothetical protein
MVAPAPEDRLALLFSSTFCCRRFRGERHFLFGDLRTCTVGPDNHGSFIETLRLEAYSVRSSRTCDTSTERPLGIRDGTGRPYSQSNRAAKNPSRIPQLRARVRGDGKRLIRGELGRDPRSAKPSRGPRPDRARWRVFASEKAGLPRNLYASDKLI